jgi:hypothetical protein
MERLSREYRVSVAVPILQGLLSSGQFTEPPSDGNERAHVKRLDMGANWQKDGYCRQHMSAAVLTALNLSKELIDQTELEAAAGV